MSDYQFCKQLVGKLDEALYNLEPSNLRAVMGRLFSRDCTIRFCVPFGDLQGPAELFEQVYQPLTAAVPDLERRNFIKIAGPSEGGGDWVGCAGNYVGVFEHPWLDIPPTIHPVFMRYHEFFRIEGNQIVEMQAIWDIPQLMMQAGAWPLSPSLGIEWMVPGPAAQDGLSLPPRSGEGSEKTLKLVNDMLDGLMRHREEGPEAMHLEQFWHPKMTWYGPSGIGSNRRISGFRNWHQIPFLKAMPDRDMNDEVPHYFFCDGPYAGVTGWPNMKLTLSGDGWLGIPPTGKTVTMKSLDFWRRDGDLLRENWVLVDILDVYRQLGVDPFSRMRELTAARQEMRPNLWTNY